MQAAQIDPDKIYALRLDDRGIIVRFKVLAVESHLFRRTLKASSANYTHKVHGIIDERDLPEDMRNALPQDQTNRIGALKRIVGPESIEDEYNRFQELKERAAAEEAAAQAIRDEEKRAAEELVKYFYHITSLKPAEKKFGSYTDESPFIANDYKGTVGISKEGVGALITALENAFNLVK